MDYSLGKVQMWGGGGRGHEDGMKGRGGRKEQRKGGDL